MAFSPSDQLIPSTDVKLFRPKGPPNFDASLSFRPQRALQKEEEERHSTKNDGFHHRTVAPLLRLSVTYTNSIRRVLKEERSTRTACSSQDKQSHQLPTTAASAPEQASNTEGLFSHILSPFPGWGHAPVLAMPLQTSTTQKNSSVDINFTAASMKAWADAQGKAPPPLEHTRAVTRYQLRPLQHRIAPGPVSASEGSLVQNKQVKSHDRLSEVKSRKSASRSRHSPVVSRCLTDFHQELIEILPMDTRQQMRQQPRLCVAWTKRAPHARCTKSTGTLKNYNNSLSTLKDLITKRGDNSSAIIRQLLECTLCGGSHRKKAKAEFEKILEDLDDLSEDSRCAYDDWVKALLSEPEPTTEGSTISTLDTADRAPSPTIAPHQENAVELATSYRQITRAMALRSLQNRKTAASPATTALSEYSLPYFQNFRPYQPKCTANRSTTAVLRDLIEKPLTDRELESGSIYMYWFPGNFGYLKIGKTSRNVTKRLDEWQKQCKHAVESVSSDFAAVIHVYRVEALVHAELKEVRYHEVNCRGCGCNHREWFLETPEHARRVDEKWKAFIKTSPYVDVGGEWKLREDISEEEIERLCTPLERIGAPAKRTRLSNSRLRSSVKARLSI
jgi:T5orf172 domain